MTSRRTLFVILIVSVLICGYDVNAAMRGGGHNPVAWILAAIMAFVALIALRKILRQDYSNSWW